MLAQAEGESEAKESQNEDLDAVAEFLAQLDASETERLTALVETKSKALAELDAEVDVDDEDGD